MKQCAIARVGRGLLCALFLCGCATGDQNGNTSGPGAGGVSDDASSMDDSAANPGTSGAVVATTGTDVGATGTDVGTSGAFTSGASSGGATSGTSTSGVATTGTGGVSGDSASGMSTSGTATSGTAMSGAATSGSATSGTAVSGSTASGTATTGSATTGTATSGSASSGTGAGDGGPPKCASNVLTPTAATASSMMNPAANAIDGKFNTRWESVQMIDPQWIDIDFGAPAFINRVEISWEQSCAANYTLAVSNDKMTWTTIKTIVGNMMGTPLATPPIDWTTAVDSTGLSGVGRYLRVNGTVRCSIHGVMYGYSIWEMRAFGDTNATCTP